MTRYEMIYDYLKDAYEDVVVSLWNQKETYENGTNHIYNRQEFDDILMYDDPSEIAFKIFYGDFNPNDDYFIFDGRGNLESSNYLETFVCYDELAQYIDDNDETFGFYDLKCIFEEFEEMQEEAEAE